MVQCHSENDGASKIIVVQLYLGAQAVLVPLITGEAIRNQQLALPQYANTLLSCVRYQIPRPHNLLTNPRGQYHLSAVSTEETGQNTIRIFHLLATSEIASLAGLAISLTRHSAIGALCSFRIAAALWRSSARFHSGVRAHAFCATLAASITLFTSSWVHAGQATEGRDQTADCEVNSFCWLVNANPLENWLVEEGFFR